MRRLRRFLRARGLGSTLAVLGLCLSATLGFAVATRTEWQLPLVSNLLWVLVVVIVASAGVCWWKWPEGRSSEETTVIQTPPADANQAPDPVAQAKGGGNIDDKGPTIEVPRGSKTEVPRSSTVRVVDSEEKGDEGSGAKPDGNPSSS